MRKFLFSFHFLFAEAKFFLKWTWKCQRGRTDLWCDSRSFVCFCHMYLSMCVRVSWGLCYKQQFAADYWDDAVISLLEKHDRNCLFRRSQKQGRFKVRMARYDPKAWVWHCTSVQHGDSCLVVSVAIKCSFSSWECYPCLNFSTCALSLAMSCWELRTEE